MNLRPREQYGNIELSIQASSFAYSTPRVDGLPLDEYYEVEVAIIANGKIRSPVGLLSDDLCQLFEKGLSPVAGYVSQENVERIRQQLLHG